MDLPLGLLIAAASSGWVLVGVVVRMIFRGQLLTPREAKAMERRIEAQDKAIAVKDETIDEFKDAIVGAKDAIGTQNALLSSLVEVAKEQRSP